MWFKAAKSRPLLVLLPLLVGQLALLSLQLKDKEGTSVLKHTVLQILSPLLVFSHTCGHLVSGFWSEYINLREVRNENEALREKITELILLNQQRDAVAAEARRLQMILDLKTRMGGKICAAGVIARSPTFLSFTILLDRGFNQGVRKDNPVITTDGVVGRVIDTHASTCEVQVLVDSDAAAGAILARTRIQGVLNGRGGLLLKLNYLLNQEDVQVGDLVVTSGMDNIYPKDLPLGRVVRVNPGESVFKEIDVFPTANFNKLEEVLILLETPAKP